MIKIVIFSWVFALAILLWLLWRKINQKEEIIIKLPPFVDIDDSGNYVGNNPEFIEKDEPYIGGYLHFYIKDGEIKRKFIPKELKDSFMGKFGHDLLNADENEVNEFLISNQNKL